VLKFGVIDEADDVFHYKIPLKMMTIETLAENESLISSIGACAGFHNALMEYWRNGVVEKQKVLGQFCTLGRRFRLKPYKSVN
jgi:hypothetical protein